jgi:hypothetical protein
MKCVDVLEKTQPDYLATGHWRIHTWKPEYADGLRKYIKGRNAALTRLIAQEDPNFGYDMHWARLEPYRMVAQEGDVFEIEAKVRNHLSRTGKADMRLTLPEGWTCEPPVAEWDIAAKTESAFTFRVNVPAGTKPERFVIGLDAKMDAADIGEIGMAIIDIGEDHARELTDPGKYAAKDYAFF